MFNVTLDIMKYDYISRKAITKATELVNNSLFLWQAAGGGWRCLEDNGSESESPLQSFVFWYKILYVKFQNI